MTFMPLPPGTWRCDGPLAGPGGAWLLLNGPADRSQRWRHPSQPGSHTCGATGHPSVAARTRRSASRAAHRPSPATVRGCVSGSRWRPVGLDDLLSSRGRLREVAAYPMVPSTWSTASSTRPASTARPWPTGCRRRFRWPSTSGSLTQPPRGMYAERERSAHSARRAALTQEGPREGQHVQAVPVPGRGRPRTRPGVPAAAPRRRRVMEPGARHWYFRLELEVDTDGRRRILAAVTSPLRRPPSPRSTWLAARRTAASTSPTTHRRRLPRRLAGREGRHSATHLALVPAARGRLLRAASRAD